MARQPKVFVTSDGLTDYVVAATSRAKALAAWGIHQDLFKAGQAHETDDPALVKAARGEPGKVLRRPAGTRGKLQALKLARPAAPKGPTKAQRKKVADLEARLGALDDQEAQAQAALAKAQAELARKAEAETARRAAQRSRLASQLAKAREALG